ncbi:MAG: hypothetical protein GXP62_03190, partial [Oligoflexia bacterium]|nr:hypothetical protein [Oligoflexia bacterium]
MSFDIGELRYIAPQITVFLFGLLVLMNDVLFRKSSREISLSVTLLGLGVAALLNLLTLQGLDAPVLAFNGMLAVDQFGLFLNFVILLAGAASLLIGHDFLRRVDVAVPEYNPMVLFTVFGMLLMANANDLMLLFISLEIMSIGLYVLTGINRGEVKGAEGAFKYFVMGAFASSFLLMGIAFIYGTVGSTQLRAVAQWFAI